jgi:hypothetical protein
VPLCYNQRRKARSIEYSPNDGTGSALPAGSPGGGAVWQLRSQAKEGSTAPIAIAVVAVLRDQ